MFESASIRRPGLLGDRFDIGRILESMLYYDKVHLYLDMQFFTGIWRMLGYAGMKDLLAHPSVVATITPEFCGVKNETAGGVTTHIPILGRLAGDKDHHISDNDYAGILYWSVKNMDGYSSKRQIENLVKLAKKTEYKNLLGSEVETNSLFFSAVSDPISLKMFVHQWAKTHNVKIDNVKLEEMEISTIRCGNEIAITSDQSLSSVVISPGTTIDGQREWQNILPAVHDYIIDLHLSNTYSSDFVCQEGVGHIAEARVDLSLKRGLRSSNQVSAFKQKVFGNSRAFSEAINRGNLDISDALRVIDRTRKFRDWARSIPPSEDLLNAYNEAVSKDSVLERLPAKALRFAFFTGAGLSIDALAGSGGLGTAIGVGASALDTFLLDKIAKGWRPNSFVKTVSQSIQE